MIISGESFATSPPVEVSAIPVVIRSSSAQLRFVDVPASVVTQPGSYLLEVPRRNAARTLHEFATPIIVSETTKDSRTS